MSSAPSQVGQTLHHSEGTSGGQVTTNDALHDDTPNILRAGGLEAVDAPVLLIAGENSPRVAHDIIDALAERLPDVGRAIVPGAGHMAPLTHPEQVAGLIGVNLERA